MGLKGQNGLYVKYVDQNHKKLSGLIELFYSGIFRDFEFKSGIKFKKLIKLGLDSSLHISNMDFIFSRSKYARNTCLTIRFRNFFCGSVWFEKWGNLFGISRMNKTQRNPDRIQNKSHQILRYETNWGTKVR